MKILNFAEANHACTYYRNLLPSQFMARDGIFNIVIEVNWKYSDNKSKEVLRNIARQVDVIRFSRFGDWIELIKYANKHKIPTIYGTDDYFILGRENQFNIVAQKENWAEQCKKSATLCNGVLVSTEALREAYLQYNNYVYVLPNMLDFEQKQWHQPKRKPDGKIIVGYYGSPTHAYDLLKINSVIAGLMYEYPNLEFHYGAMPLKTMYKKDGKYQSQKLIGIFQKENRGKKDFEVVEKPDDPIYKLYCDISQNMPQERVKFLDWRSINDYGGVYANFDIAIAPLNNTPINYYKSNLKILEAGAYYLPVVCSAIRPFVETIAHGVDGFIAQDTSQFGNYLEELINSPKLRHSLGRALGEKVRINYNIRTQYRRWIYCIDAIVRNAQNKKIISIQPVKQTWKKKLGRKIKHAFSKNYKA